MYNDSSHDLGLYAGLSVLGGMSFGVLIHALMGSGRSHARDHLPQHAPGVIGADVLALNDSGHLMPRSLRRPKPATTAERPPSYGLSRVMTLDVTQPPSPAEMGPENLKALITASEGRSLLDFKGLQPVCWNVIAGDLVRAARARARACTSFCAEDCYAIWMLVSFLRHGFEREASITDVCRKHTDTFSNGADPKSIWACASGCVLGVLFSHGQNLVPALVAAPYLQVHNFADGVTVGAAFLGCSTAIGWTVTASAVLHEVPHELADFMALLNGGMSVKQVRLLCFVYLSEAEAKTF